MNKIKLFRILTIILGICILTYSMSHSNSAEKSSFENELQKVKYNYAEAFSGDALDFDEFSDELKDDGFDQSSGYKSPGKAFLLSLIVPGLGQYYYGSKLKPIAFIGVEAASWLLYSNWHSKGNELTDEFEAFNDAHWNQSRYEDYLAIAYGVRDDDLVSGAPEISHNLPDTKTQQYYEMTGKYDQFAWGWDDASLNGMTHADFDSAGGFPPPINNDQNTPYSSRRLLYETMRNDANSKLDDANKMLMVVLANHLISAFEAFITTKAKNNGSRPDSEFSRFKVKPLLRSYNALSDTPYLNLSYKF